MRNCAAGCSVDTLRRACAQTLQERRANLTQPVPADQSWRLDFLAGGGEMGERMRAFDWTTTLGPPQHRPQSLKTAVRMLTSRQPFWLGWGPDLTYL